MELYSPMTAHEAVASTRDPAFPSLFSRRSIVQAALAGLVGPALAGERPPVFRTRRYQFTELDPVLPMPQLSLPRLDGKTAPLRAAPGQVTLVYLWATWCPICRIELPLFESQLAAFERNGIGLVAICTDGADLKAVRNYLLPLGVKRLPVFWDAGGRHLSAPGAGGSEAPFALTSGLPITYLVDPRGGIRGYLLGEADWTSPEAASLLAFFARA